MKNAKVLLKLLTVFVYVVVISVSGSVVLYFLDQTRWLTWRSAGVAIAALFVVMRILGYRFRDEED